MEPRENNQNPELLSVRFFRRHVPAIISYLLLFFFVFLAGASIYLYIHQDNSTKVMLQNGGTEGMDFVYGSWPALQSADFFQKTKERFIEQEVSFIEVDLSSMTIRFYKEGEMKLEAPVNSKGRDGSWWETPAGLYKVSLKEKSHFSSLGRVYMPWSMQFQGNFFIHGPTHYPDGTPTASTYSGGCVRIGLEDAEEIYRMSKIGTPVLVFEESFNGSKYSPKYENKKVLPDDLVYLAVDLENNFVFAENKSGEKHSVASITKLLTALVAVEYINVEREVTITPSMLATTSISRLKEGENVAVLDLLSLLLLESSNEAAIAMAKPLGRIYFVRLMNIKAEAIGMKNSNFVDTSGVLSGNISTAEDLFRLAKYLYYNRSFILHMSMGNENRIAYGPRRYRWLQNFNKVPEAEGLIGAKTGLSSSAGDSMLSVFELEIGGQKRPVAIIVLGSKDAKEDIGVLLKYIADNFLIETDKVVPVSEEVI